MNIMNVVKKTASIAIVSMLVAVMPLSADDGRHYCHLKKIDGEAMIQRANENEIGEAFRNMPVMAGDRIWTEYGRVQVQLSDGSIFSLDYNTKVDFEAIGESLERYSESTLVKLWGGSVYLSIFRDYDKNENLQIETLAGYISILNRGSYRIDMDEDYTLRVTVYEGLAEIGNDNGVTMVRSGQRLFLEPGDKPNDVVRISERDSDDFVAWVEDNLPRYRDTRSAGYVDDSLDYLVDEMDDYGDWRYYDEYDTHVWIPRSTYLNTGWRPYNNGHWVWTPHGWTFVSYDPWGWATYRYGRWDWTSWGWCWIPGYRYSSAWVHWEIGNRYIGWTPLGYYNYPVNRYRNKRYPRGYRRISTGSRVDMNNGTWTVVKKSNFGKLSAGKYAMGDNEIKNLNRKNAKTITMSSVKTGFADRKLTYKTSSKASSTSKISSFRNIPSGIYRKSGSTKYSTKGTSGYKYKPTTGSSYKATTGKSTYSSSYKKSSSSSKYYKSGRSGSYSTKSPSSTKYKSSKSSSSSGKTKSYTIKSKPSSSSSKKSSGSSTSTSTKKKNKTSYNSYTPSYRTGSSGKTYRSNERYARSGSSKYYSGSRSKYSSGSKYSSSSKPKYYSSSRSRSSGKYRGSSSRYSSSSRPKYYSSRSSSSSRYKPYTSGKSYSTSRSSSSYKSRPSSSSSKSYRSSSSSSSGSKYSSSGSSSRSSSGRSSSSRSSSSSSTSKRK